jgi:hypothetical protein
MLRYAEIAQNIIDAHPNSVHQLLMRKGITKKATPEVLKDAYVLFGKPFISELTDIIHRPKSGYADFISLSSLQTFQPVAKPAVIPVPSQPVQTLQASVTDAVEKKTIWDGLANVFDTVVNVTSKVLTTAQTAKDIVQPANGSLNVFQIEEKKALEEAENKKYTRTLLIVSAVVIVVLVSLIFITRKK